MAIRGDVFLRPTLLPGNDQPIEKFNVVLQSTGRTPQPQIAVVIASSDRRDSDRLQPYQVLVGERENFSRDTIIDCRWVFTFLRSEVDVGSPITHLPQSVMDRIDVALFAGLQMRP